jgi:hypothetical protein
MEFIWECMAITIKTTLGGIFIIITAILMAVAAFFANMGWSHLKELYNRRSDDER